MAKPRSTSDASVAHKAHRHAPRIDRRRLGFAGIGLAVVLFLAVNLLGGAYLTSTRLDLTQDHLFTLSNGTKEVLASIDEPIDLRLYYTKQLDELGPYFSGHAQRVEELLATYRRLSHGKLRIERLDPAPFSPEEDLAVAEGLEGLPIKDDGTLAYFGLTGRNSTDDTQAIRYLAPERANFLEYDLTRMIADLANPKKPVVAVLGDLPLMGSQFNQYEPWKVLDAMFQVFDVRFLGGKQGKIDDDVQVLMLAQPHNVDPATLYAIDQFVMRGGRVLAFVDPLAEVMAAGGGMNPMANAEGDAVKAMEPLLAAWGVSIPDGKVIGDRAAAQRVSARLRGRQIVVDYLPWLALGQDQLAANDVVTGQLKRLHLNSVGSIEKRKDATTTIEPLVVSSPLAEEIDAEKIKTEPDPAKLIADFVAAGSPFTLAARVTGPVKSAYPDGPPEGVKSDAPQLKEAKQPLNLILVADADLLADSTWVRSQSLLGQQVDVPIANNGDFAINALDNLAGTQGLISLRGRGLTDRPFEVVKAMERDAEAKFRAKEQELQAKIDETQKKIRSLQDEEQQSGVILTAAQQQEIENFRGEMIGLRQELRGVQRSLRENVEHLSTWVKIINIWAVPVLIALLALGVGIYRRLRIARSAATAT
jgi:gliding motility-associatede transport system auxiliary component